MPPFRVFYDGSCIMCRREAALMHRLDRGRGLITLEDITSPGFDAAAIGVTQDRLMAEIHGVSADGRMVTGVEVFRIAYGAIGWGWVLAPTAWPVVRPIADAAYRLFARLRLRFSSGRCETGSCAVKRSPGFHSRPA